MKRSFRSGPIYEESAPMDLWLRVLLVAIVLFTLGIGVWMSTVEISGAIVMFITTVFLAALFYFILPHKYQIYEDKIRIVLGGPFAINIPFPRIANVKPGSGAQSYLYGGLRLATSSRNIVEILRKKGGGIVISPRNRDIWLEQLNQAMESYNRTHPNP